MPRHSSFSEAEDAIILTTSGAEETNKRLTEAGYVERSASSLKNRRHYLIKNAGRGAGKDAVDHFLRLAEKALTGIPEDELLSVVTRRRIVQSRIEALEAELKVLHAERDELNRAIHGRVQREIEEQQSATSEQ